MDLKILLDNIERRLKAKRLSADHVSKKAKRPDAIRNLRRRVRGEFDGSITLDTLIDIAEVLDVPVWELLRAPGAFPQDEEFREYVRGVVDEQLATRELKPKRRAG